MIVASNHSELEGNTSLVDNSDDFDGNYQEHTKELKRALGKSSTKKISINKLTDNLRSNQLLIEVAHSRRFETYTEYGQLISRQYAAERKYQTRAILHKKLEDVAKCSINWTDGQPSYVCQQPLLCSVCNRSRAQSVFTRYIGFAFAYARTRKYFEAHHFTVKSERYDERYLPQGIVSISNEMQAMRRSISDQDHCRRRKGQPRQNNFPLYDCFFHCSAVSRADSEIFQPHFHIVVAHGSRNRSDSSVQHCFRDYCDKNGLTLYHARKIRITREAQYLATGKPPRDMAYLGFYNSTPFKADQLTEYQRLVCLMSLPKQMKLMRRKKDVQKFVVKYRNTAVPTKDSFHFSPEHGIFLPGPQTI